MYPHYLRAVLTGIAVLPFVSAAHAANLGTAFSYQGFLEKPAGTPVTDTCDFRFGLWNAAGGGAQKGTSPQTVTGVSVTNGGFSVAIDFGAAAIDGTARWLAIEVICLLDPNYPTYELLTPRVELKPAPHALALPGLYTQQNSFSPNVVGGLHENTVSLGVSGATISGGGAPMPDINHVTDTFGAVGGGCTNRAGNNSGSALDAQFATVGGGFTNVASGSYSTIGGGRFNTASDDDSTVGGGISNMASGDTSTVAGGTANNATGYRSTVGGGDRNTSSGPYSTIAGGFFSTASMGYATVAGGNGNSAGGIYTTVGGGLVNTANGDYSTVGGGHSDAATGDYSTVGGGNLNTASGDYSTVGGGRSNVSSAAYATIAGGGPSDPSSPATILATRNRVTDEYGTIGGGGNNQAGDNAGTTSDKIYATVGGGILNTASGGYSTIGGGVGNTASAERCTIGGGDQNQASGLYSTVGGGAVNTAGGAASTVVGGNFNTAGGQEAFVGGGLSNTASGARSTVGGGDAHNASGAWSTVGGGTGNTPSGNYSTVCGGSANTASGVNSAVPGGLQNVAGGDSSFAAGTLAKVRTEIEVDGAGGDLDGDEGTFVWADSFLAPFQSTGPDQFLIRASGGVGIGTASPSHPLEMFSGAHVTAGGVWTDASSREVKENFADVDARRILSSVVSLPVNRWNYRNENDGITHIGPVAEDFHKAFETCQDDKYLAALDTAGVALAAIQGLYEIVQEKDCEIAEVSSEISNLKSEIANLKELVGALAAQNGSSR